MAYAFKKEKVEFSLGKLSYDPVECIVYWPKDYNYYFI
jgi:hypothetical protein